MSPDSVFLACNYGVLPFWLLLAVVPGWPWTDRLVHRVWIPGTLACVYLWALLANPGSPEGGGFGSLAGVMALFTSPHAVLAGWIHYLAFDLFIGAWQVRDARRRGIPHAWVLPCLFFTLMLGPAGLLLYLTVRFRRTRALSLEETGV
jgi:hypothetical protein